MKLYFSFDSYLIFLIQGYMVYFIKVLMQLSTIILKTKGDELVYDSFTDLKARKYFVQ